LGPLPFLHPFSEKSTRTMHDHRPESDAGIPVPVPHSTNPAAAPPHQEVEPWYLREVSGAPYWLIVVVGVIAAVILTIAYLASAA
jgi:hypothetical protein